MKISFIILAALFSTTLTACEERPDKAPVPHTDNAPGDGLFQDQRDALDKAKSAGQSLEQQSTENKQAIDQQTR